MYKYCGVFDTTNAVYHTVPFWFHFFRFPIHSKAADTCKQWADVLSFNELISLTVILLLYPYLLTIKRSINS